MAEKSQSFREILHLIPPFVSPSASWTQKVKLIIKHSCSGSEEFLQDAIVSKLPEPLFTQVQSRCFTSVDGLLSYISHLEKDSSLIINQRFFNEKCCLAPGQKPSLLYTELLSLAKQLSPPLEQDALLSIVKSKFLSALPFHSQVLLSTIADQDDFDKTLKILDDTFNVTLSPLVAQVGVKKEEDDITSPLLEEIIARITKLESGRPSNSVFRPGKSEEREELCWYHFKFGNKALKCQPPCRFYRSSSKN